MHKNFGRLEVLKGITAGKLWVDGELGGYRQKGDKLGSSAC